MVFTAALLLLVLLWWRGLLVALGRVALSPKKMLAFLRGKKSRLLMREREEKDVPEDRNRVVEEGSSRLGEGDCNHPSLAITLLDFFIFRGIRRRRTHA